MDNLTEFYGTGKRKTSVARVHLRPGNGEFQLNDRNLDDFFGGHETLKMIVRQPFTLTETIGAFDIVATVAGGGVASQAGAIRHGIARALCEQNIEHRKRLKKAGLHSMPGGGAEIFSKRLQKLLHFTGKADADRWCEIHGIAHSLGIRTNATMLYGHVETMEERVDHLLRLRQQQLGVEAEVTVGELVGLTGLAEQALHHAHLGVEVVDLRNEHGLGGRGDDGCAPLQLALVAEHDVLETFEQVGVELGLEPGLADELVAENDMALEDALAALGGDQVALVFDHLAGVMHQHAGQRDELEEFEINECTPKEQTC